MSGQTEAAHGDVGVYPYNSDGVTSSAGAVTMQTEIWSNGPTSVVCPCPKYCSGTPTGYACVEQPNFVMYADPPEHNHMEVFTFFGVVFCGIVFIMAVAFLIQTILHVWTTKHKVDRILEILELEVSEPAIETKVDDRQPE